MSNQTERPLTPLVIAFVLVYAVALLICGILVNGTIVLAFVTVGVMAATAGTGGAPMSHTGHAMTATSAKKVTAADLRVTLDRLLGEHAVVYGYPALAEQDDLAPADRGHSARSTR